MTDHGPDLRRVLGCIAVAAATLLAAACGGGEDEKTRFQAGRVIAFGDESSLLVDSGDHNARKFSVNSIVSTTDPTIECTGNPLWVQSVAGLYGLVFPECNHATPPVAAPVSRIRAAFGARAVDLAGQIAAQQAESPMQGGDLATVMVGANDVFAQYAQFPAVSEAELIANVEEAGAETGRQVNVLANLGVKVVLSTIIDVGATPFALAERAAHTDTDRAALLTRLSARFNGEMRATMLNDGRRIGLVLFDEFVSAVGKNPAAGGFVDTTTGICDLTKSMLTPPSILDCTRQTLVAGAVSPPDANGAVTVAAFLWADDRHLSAAGQFNLGSFAASRAQNNPF